MRFRTVCNGELRVLEVRELRSAQYLLFVVRSGWYDVVGEGEISIAIRGDDGSVEPVNSDGDCLAQLQQASTLLVMVGKRVGLLAPHVSLVPFEPRMERLQQLATELGVVIWSSFAMGSGMWRVEALDPATGAGAQDEGKIEALRLGLLLATAQEEASAPPPPAAAPLREASTPGPASQEGRAAAAGTAAGPDASTRSMLLAAGIDAAALDAALRVLGETADPVAVLDEIDELARRAPPRPLRLRQRSGDAGRRPVGAVVDGMNVAVAGGLGRTFSGRTLACAYEQLRQLGCDPIRIVLPARRIQEAARIASGGPPRLTRFPVVDAARVVELERLGVLVAVPPTASAGNSYDDVPIVEIGMTLDALVVSCDKYRDLAERHPGIGAFLRTRRVPFSASGSIFELQTDPHGRRGPSLGEMLVDEPDPKRWRDVKFAWKRLR